MDRRSWLTLGVASIAGFIAAARRVRDVATKHVVSSVSPDLTLLLASDAKGKGLILDGTTGKTKHKLKIGGDYVNAAAFSPDGTTVATSPAPGLGGGGGSQVTLWDTDTGKQIAALPGGPGYGHSTGAIAFSANGKLLAAGEFASVKSDIRLWDVGTRRLLRTLKGHTRQLTSIAFAPGSTSLVSAGYDGTAKRWSLRRAR